MLCLEKKSEMKSDLSHYSSCHDCGVGKCMTQLFQIETGTGKVETDGRLPPACPPICIPFLCSYINNVMQSIHPSCSALAAYAEHAQVATWEASGVIVVPKMLPEKPGKG